MQILSWTENYWPSIGGVETYLARLLPALAQRGHKVALVTGSVDPDLPEKEMHSGIPIYRFPFVPTLAERRPEAIFDLRRRISELKEDFAPDILQINFTGPSVYFHMQTRQACPAPYVVDAHISVAELPAGVNTLFCKLLKEAAWIVAHSNAVLNDTTEAMPELLSRSSVLYYGVDRPKAAPKQIDFDAPRLLCVGRLVHEKGFDIALRAFAMLAPRFPAARMVIAGGGAARQELEQLATDLGVADSVEFPGWVSPGLVPDLINDAALVVIPSRWREAFGLIAVETALMERPIVASRVGGIEEAVGNSDAGVLVDKEDPRALADAIADLLEHPEKARQMGRTARRRAENLFEFGKHVEEVDALYQRILSMHG